MNLEKKFRKGILFAGYVSMLASPVRPNVQTPPESSSNTPEIICLGAPSIGPHISDTIFFSPESANYITKDGGSVFSYKDIGYMSQRILSSGPNKGKVMTSEGTPTEPIKGQCNPGETLATRITQGRVYLRTQKW